MLFRHEIDSPSSRALFRQQRRTFVDRAFWQVGRRLRSARSPPRYLFDAPWLLTVCSGQLIKAICVWHDPAETVASHLHQSEFYCCSCRGKFKENPFLRSIGSALFAVGSEARPPRTLFRLAGVLARRARGACHARWCRRV